MAIPSSGEISLLTIQTEFGGSNPISLSEYYAGGGLVAAGTSGTNGPVPSSGQISVSNFYGTSAVTVPGAPTIGTATISFATASVSFTAPASNGGSVITSYTATSSPGGITGTLSQAGSGTITVSGLSGGTSYTFTVRATNAVGQGPASAASNSVTAIAAGQQEFTTIGTFSWTAPAGVTSVSVLSVGPGVSMRGGNLSYINNYSVTPGSSYTVQLLQSDKNIFVNTSTLFAAQGANKFPTNVGGNSEYNPPASPVKCGGGAGGYVAQNNPSIDGRGAGGDGDAGTFDRSDGGANTGGGGGGGGYYSDGNGTLWAGAGGGVGLLGQGSSGGGGSFGNGGGGGSGGSSGGRSGNSGGTGIAGAYGGSANQNYSGSNNVGAVRIIWPGSSRSFPSTNTGNV